jgi:hypothetical protein
MTEHIEPATEVACTILGIESVDDDLYAVLQHDDATEFRQVAAAYVVMQEADEVYLDAYPTDGQSHPPLKEAKILLGELVEEYGIKLESFVGTVVQQPDGLILDNGYLIQEYHSTELTGHSPKLGEKVRVERDSDAGGAVVSPISDDETDSPTQQPRNNA